jgi:hypothetical protein
MGRSLGIRGSLPAMIITAKNIPAVLEYRRHPCPPLALIPPVQAIIAGLRDSVKDFNANVNEIS